MDLTTKFDKGQLVFTIDRDEIVKFQVEKIEVVFEQKARIKYVLLRHRAVNFGDPDSVITKSEDECFKTLGELIVFYDQKLNKNK
jgi:hypothetical protein